MASCIIQSGSIGFSTNVCNVVAGVFIATGQDVACVAEGSIAHVIVRGVTKDEIDKRGNQQFCVCHTHK